MATRRISSAYIAYTARSGVLPPLLPRYQSFFRAALPAARYLQTSPIRYRQVSNTKAKRDAAPAIVRGASKLFRDADSAVADLKSGSTILSAGFGLCGTAGKE
jgi:3-oxoacid CoA-transferase